VQRNLKTNRRLKSESDENLFWSGLATATGWPKMEIAHIIGQRCQHDFRLVLFEVSIQIKRESNPTPGISTLLGAFGEPSVCGPRFGRGLPLPLGDQARIGLVIPVSYKKARVVAFTPLNSAR